MKSTTSQQDMRPSRATQGNSAPQPDTVPLTISLPEAAIEAVLDAQRRIDEINTHLGSYAAGLRHGLNVPEDWKLDMKRRAFVPPGGDVGANGGDQES